MVRGKGIRRDERKITRHTRLGNARGGENKEKGKSKRKHSSGKKKWEEWEIIGRKETGIMHMRITEKKEEMKK